MLRCDHHFVTLGSRALGINHIVSILFREHPYRKSFLLQMIQRKSRMAACLHIACTGTKHNSMKPIFVVLLLMIVLSSSAFVMIYNQWKDIVEANPVIFAAGLISIVLSGAVGMLYMIISRPALQPVSSK